ncbi:MAG: helix-turn-helix transcriptional regulator [Bacteroidota bacterium]
MENKAIGRNISILRKLRDKKAFDIAEQLGMKEAAYIKYERGETQITIEFIQKVAEILKIDPLQILTVSPNNIIDNGNCSPIAIHGESHYQTTNEEQTKMILKLMESVLSLNDRLVTMLEKKES